VCMAVLARRMTNYMLSNKYIDTTVQKGGISGILGCVEYTGVVTQIIREAKENKGDLTVIWLDLVNAYGTISHKLIDLVLQLYHLPIKIQALALQAIALLQQYQDAFHSTGLHHSMAEVRSGDSDWVHHPSHSVCISHKTASQISRKSKSRCYQQEHSWIT
jgi:hypothetical protein